jgi:hypothetical protein
VIIAEDDPTPPLWRELVASSIVQLIEQWSMTE